MTSKICALALLALAACQQRSDPPIAAPNEQAAATAVVPDGNAATLAKLPTRIPAQFHGRWGINLADCTSTRGDAKGLLTISDAQLTFYEARGTLDKIIGATDSSFAGRYGFTGEGQTWLRTERLSLVDAQLRRVTDSEPGQEPPVDLTYLRCPS